MMKLLPATAASKLGGARLNHHSTL